jgi:hypothetical protein
VQAIIAARPDVDLGIDDLISYGQCVVIGAASLRFTLDETLELVAQPARRCGWTPTRRRACTTSPRAGPSACSSR